MSAHSAAPGELATLQAGRDINGSAATLPHPLAASDLPGTLIERLARADITDFEQWRALGRRRRLIWGVTARMVDQVDAAARAAP